ncbi:hypothetical protein M9H77_13439 [Catharanthus roseus]|uniref:Uncharacterized protein n=1 Tax=Catharanthus roseus TaxID=4058 RepID=A0ACC0BK77_CATRO|nr:hypothetical protein M9H77_13439 [Catharanthus roseus]
MGMNFSNEEDAYEFYKAYAKEAGFGIRRSLSHKDNEGRILDRIFCCSSEGKRPSDKRDVISKTHRSETRVGCKAMMKINCRVTGCYQVVQVIHEHNHSLCSPSKTHLFRSHRNLSSVQAPGADIARSVGITPKATIDFMSKQIGGIKAKEKLTRRSGRRLQSSLRKTKGKRSSQSTQFLNQVSYQQNHVPVSSGSMTQIIQANEVLIVDESGGLARDGDSPHLLPEIGGIPAETTAARAKSKE